MLEMGGTSLLASLTSQELSWRRLEASCSHSGGREDVLERLVPPPPLAIGPLEQWLPRNWICVDSQEGSLHRVTTCQSISQDRLETVMRAGPHLD